MKTTWKILNLKSKSDTKMVVDVTVAVFFELDDHKERAVKKVKFEGDPASASFIPFDQLTEEIVLTWAKEKLGADELAKLEESAKKTIEEKINRESNPEFISEIPWVKE